MKAGEAGADLLSGVSGLRRLAGALVARDLNRGLVWLALGAAATAAAAVYQAYGPAQAMEIPLVGGLLRRFDRTLLAVMVLFMVLRTASCIESDHRSGWLLPYLTSGGSRRGFGLLYSVISPAVPFTVFATGAVAFAVAVSLVTGSGEFLALLPRTLGGGLLLLLSYAGLTTSAALSVRAAVPATCIVLIVTMLPHALILRYLTSDTTPPLWNFLLQFAAPLLILPSSMTGVLHAVGYGSAMVGVAMLVAARQAGRTS